MNPIEPLSKLGEMKAMFGTLITGGAASAALVAADLWFRIGASIVAIGVGILTGIYYWKKINKD